MPHLTQRCYLLILIISILGIVGQWADPIYQELWRIPAALLLIVLASECLLLRKTPLYLERMVPEKAPLGREFHGRIKIINQQSSRLRVKAIQTLSNDMSGKIQILDWDLLPGGSGT